jgi:cell division protein FtsZ
MHRYEPPAPQAEPAPAPQHPFIPPAAETPVIRPQRMPQIEDLPLPVQNQIRAQRGEMPPEPPADAKRRTLLERLASFGMSRQDEPGMASHHAPAPGPATERAAPHVLTHAGAPAAYAQPAGYAPAPRPQPSQVHAEYAKRPAQRYAQPQLDATGRIAQPQRPSEEDHLEIPAFLRRQSS